MSSPKKTRLTFSAIITATLKTIKCNPKVLLPFLIFAIIEFIALFILYFSPRMPLKAIFGPPITAFWGEQFLHYPANFLLLPKMASLSRMVSAVICNSLLTGAVVFMVYDVEKKKQLSLMASFKASFKSYIPLFLLVLIIVSLFYFSAKAVSAGLLKYFLAGHPKLFSIPAAIWMGPISISINFIISILIQSVFIYSIPFLLLKKEKLLKSIIKSFVFFWKSFMLTIFLVGLPMLIYIPVLVMTYNSAFLIDNVFPESVLLVLILGVILNSLIIDPIVTISTTLLFLKKDE